MSYESFATKLKGGHYADVGAAKKGLGKCKTLSDADKSKCLKLIESYVPGVPTKTEKKAVKRRSVAAKKVVPRAQKRAPKKVVKLAPKVKRTVRKPVDKANGLFNFNAETLKQAHLKERVGTAQQAITALQLAKTMIPTLDVSRGVKAGVDILTGVVEDMRGKVEEVVTDTLPITELMSNDENPENPEAAA